MIVSVKNITAVILLVLFVSCQNDDSPIFYEEGSNEYTNQWMQEQMKRYYYWNNTIPNNTDLSLEPGDYFPTLLFSEDYFSYAYHPLLPETVPTTIQSSFGMDIGFISFQDNLYGVILYVLSDSPAQNNGLKRGQLITSVNNTPLTQVNYNDVYLSIAKAANISLTIVEYSEEEGLSQPITKDIISYYTFLQSPYYNIVSIGEKTIGYLQISHFDVGLAQSLLNIFTEFKTNRVNEVVVDLRYNGGGDVSSATALSILLAPNIDQDDLFITFKGNQNGGEINQSFKQALEMNEFNVDFKQLRQSNIPLNKVFILCGKNTASASEIIINNLNPYIDVITIGETTRGKDMAGFPIQDNRQPDNPGWTIYPVIYKLYNALGLGDYNTGIYVDIEVDELSQVELFPLGDQNELLFNTAINHITGSSGRKENTTASGLEKTHNNTDSFVIIPNISNRK